MPHAPFAPGNFRQHPKTELILWAGLGLAAVAAWAWHYSLAAEPAAAPAAPPQQAGAGEEPFLRIARDAHDAPLALQTAIVRYVSAAHPEQGPVVDLVGAVHIGEESYYDALNQAFKNYDAVLYELVAPPGTRVAKGRGTGSSHPVAMVQNLLKSMLGLVHQLEHVDYQATNFVHADMSPEEFARSMEERGESFWTMFLKLLGQSLAQDAKARSSGRSSDWDLIAALLDVNRSQAIKRIMAEQFEDLGGALSVLDGPEGSAILTERNKVALQVLRKELDSGKRKIAVFYGAAHLPDMQRRLIADFGLVRADSRWLDAWKLGP